MKMMRQFGLVCLLTISAPAVADMTASYVGPNAAVTMKVEVASNGNVRGATGNPNSYFITRDGHGYIVQATFNGPAVMRVEDMATVMAEQMKKLMSKMPDDVNKMTPEFSLMLKKGGIVTVRGRQGVAYYIDVDRSRSPAGPPVVVISVDPKLAPLGAAMQRQMDISIGMMGKVFEHGNPFMNMQEILKTGTPLVFAGMQLDTVDNDPIADTRFSLPAEPLSLDGVRRNMGASAQ